MAFLARGRKSDLILLMTQLEIPIAGNETILQLKNILVSQEDYEEDFVKELYDQILIEKERQIEREERDRQRQIEREERDRKEALERENREKMELWEREDKLLRDQKELELKQKELEMKHEIEKLKLEQNAATIEQSTTNSNPQPSNFGLNLKKLIPDFDPNQTDISLYLVLFERQIKRAGIDKINWVSHLITLLPIDIVQIIAREEENLADNYDHIKRVLLKRFKLSPEIFRQKFIKHQKQLGTTWKDFAFELQNYLEEWTLGLEIATLEELKDLLIVDQLKRKAKQEIRDHFIDRWATLKSPNEVIDLFDSYENIRNSNIKPKDFKTEKNRLNSERDREVKTRDKSYAGPSNFKTYAEREKAYERRVTPKCYICKSENHLRFACPQLKKDKPRVESMSNLQEDRSLDLLEPYTFIGTVNGQRINILRDSGATLDLVCREHVQPGDYSGEKVWIKQPLNSELVCLPLAVVVISGDFGTIQTKAAVCASHLNRGRYLLGNRTAALIKEKNDYEFVPVGQINMVQTRAETKRLQKLCKADDLNNREIEGTDGSPRKGEEVIEIRDSDNNEEPIEIPSFEVDAPEFNLLKVDKERFMRGQLESEDLREIFDQVAEKNSEKTNKKYSIKNGLLVKNREDRLGNIVSLLVIPQELREQVKALCHESISSHLGSTKSKDKLNRYFYWPNCYKDMEEFVRSCDKCQRAGKASDKKKAPLKLVPIIQEVFSKINVDACGPLPMTENGNRYIITAMCMSSKYPEAIPVKDITSVRVTDALLTLFSRMGFPREIQCDQGTSFTSALTTDFFESFGIRVRHSSVYHPQSNMIERFNRTIKRLLRALCVESGAEWEKHLPAILLALRTVTHESTGYTPAELVYGKNLRTPETLLMEHWMEPQEENEPVTEYLVKLINRLKRCREVAIAKMEEVQIKRKIWYDKNAVKREFKEGDLVLILATNRPNKLSVQWIGPGTIKHKISETNYLVEVPGRKDKSQIYHVNMLKPYYTRPEHINLLIYDENPPKLNDQDLEIPYLENSPTVFDFLEITQSSDLKANLKDCQIDQLRELLNRFAKCFSNEPGSTDLMEHDIKLINDKPIRLKPYRLSQRQTEILKIEIKKMLKLGIIEVGESDYASPMILVEAPGKEPRPCVDYRKLNEVIRTEYFPLPNIEERVEQVSSAKYITVLDMAKGYWQIPLSKNAQRYAAFCTTFGSYICLKMQFGLKSAPYGFSRLMSELLQGCEDFAVPYLDDIAIFSDTWESHLKHIKLVLERIKRAKLTIKPSKCKFAQKHVKYLGHIVGNGARTPAEAKIKSVQDFPTPRTKTQVRAFLGLSGYYAHYIKGYSVIAAPLTDALKGKTKKGEITWTPECERAFTALKKSLTETPVLHAPNFDREFIVQTDASNSGMGVVLSQLDEKGEEHPILYLSKKFSDVEKRYGTTEKECASIIFAVKRLHYYLDGHKFEIITDHNPLVWLRTNASSNPRLMRWALALQPYDFVIRHKPGKEHRNADSLSRSEPGD